MELKRYRHLDRLESLLTCYPVVAILSSALVLRQLQPWNENISKRQVKAPKVYIAGSGLLHLPREEYAESEPAVPSIVRLTMLHPVRAGNPATNYETMLYYIRVPAIFAVSLWTPNEQGETSK